MKQNILLMMGTAALSLGMMTAANAQTTTPPSSMPAVEHAHRGQAVRNFDEYLDRHPEVREELRRNPKLANDPNYLAKHPGLQKFESTHPGVQKDLSQHPDRFMKHESKYQRWERRHGRDRDFRRDRDRDRR